MKSVMIVDNDPIMLEIIASLLRDHGVFFRIIKVENSAKAIITLYIKITHSWVLVQTPEFILKKPSVGQVIICP